MHEVGLIPTLLVKSISESGDDMVLSATLVQRALFPRHVSDELGSDAGQFEFRKRVNNMASLDGMFLERGEVKDLKFIGPTAEANEKLYSGFCKSYDCLLPLTIEEKFNAYPFRIVSATLALEYSHFLQKVEGSSSAQKEDSSTPEVNLYPNILVPAQEKTQFFVYKWDEADFITNFDHSKRYDVFLNSPRIKFLSESQKGEDSQPIEYWSKIEISFYLWESPVKRLMEILVPNTVLLCFLIRNCFVDEDDDYFANLITLFFTLCVIIPEIRGEASLVNHVTPTDGMIAFFSFGFAIAAIPNYYTKLFGTCLVVLSYGFPLWAYIMLRKCKSELVSESGDYRFFRPKSKIRPKGNELDLDLFSRIKRREKEKEVLLSKLNSIFPVIHQSDLRGF